MHYQPSRKEFPSLVLIICGNLLYFCLNLLMENNEFRSLLQSVIQHWQQSAKAYAEYMENGKKFRDSEKLKMHNTAVKDLLTDNSALIPGNFKEDVEAIVEHYTIWTAKWDDLNSKLNPFPEDEFAFENDHRFPKAAAQKLEAAFHDLTINA
jgi:hypothetical protein